MSDEIDETILSGRSVAIAAINDVFRSNFETSDLIRVEFED